jgi:hypothetical protein
MTAWSKRRALIAGIFAVIIPAMYFLLKAPLFHFNAALAPKNRISTNDISVYLEDGDIICRLGDRLWSVYFKDISPVDKRFSHLGIIRIIDNKITVINAEGRAVEGKDYVNEVELDAFLEAARSIGIYRLDGYDGKIISSTAMEFIGYPFDWSFSMEEENKLYCTKLLYVVLRKIAPEIQLKSVFQKELKREVIPVEACSNSKYFKEILYICAN